IGRRCQELAGGGPDRRMRRSGLGGGPCGPLFPSARAQERGAPIGETVWVLPEQQMAQLWEYHELGAWDALREQLAVARVHHSVGVAVHDQRACVDAHLPQTARVAR